MDRQMRVDGVRYPAPAPAQPSKKFNRVPLIPLRSFIWLPIIGLLIAGVLIFGTPHLRWTYDFYAADRFDAPRHYTRCDYLGWHSQRLFPGDGHCPLIAFLKKYSGGKP